MIPGLSFDWSFDVEDNFDLTNYTAQMFIDDVDDTGDLSVTVTVSNVGVNICSTLSLLLDGVVTAEWPAGAYKYRVVLTAPSPSTSNGIAVWGVVLVRTPRPV